jgi:hypothetical protein
MDASLRSAQRLLGQWVPRARAADGPGPTLETLPPAAESPRLVAAPTAESGPMCAHRVSGDPAPGFSGFLDGTQASRILCHVQGVPIVHGTVAAAIRERRNRRLVTWRYKAPIDRAVYMPRGLVPVLWDNYLAAGMPLVDTGEPIGISDAGIAEDDVHPTALAERAVHFVEARRQRLERELAEEWCRSEGGPLWIDGGISGSERVASSGRGVGVVKHHRTLYVSPGAVAMLAALAAGERTTVFRLAPTRRTPVLSWYLRVRDASGRAPTWGLVRIEISESDHATLAERADLVSRWVLAERAPLALPDPRWHAMPYGVRDCEELLRAIT